MEYLAQELLDGIIDQIPLERMRPCSLVARNWRRRCQQRHFESLWFRNEDLVVRWYTRISQDPEGIPSYVHLVQLSGLKHCREPGMLNRVLRLFVNLRSLRLIQIELSLLSEQRNPILFNNFGRGVTKLLINHPACTYGTFVSLIHSFPDLETLIIIYPEPEGVPPSTLSSAPKRILKELRIYHGGSEIAMALSKCLLSFQEIAIARPELSRGSPSAGLRALLAASSGTVEKVTLGDLAYTPDESQTSHPCAKLPPLVALRELHVHLGRHHTPPRWSANLLAAMTSAPELSSVYFGSGSLFDLTPEEAGECVSDDRWMSIDGWLARLATGRGRSPALTVVLAIPINGESPSLGGFLSKCRSAGVRVTIVPG